MPYVLGIDLGASDTAAAVCVLDRSVPATPRMVALGEHTDTVASVLRLRPDGTVTPGRGPGPVACGFVARVGDPVPHVVGGRHYLAHDLAAALAAWVVDHTTALLGAEPDRVVLTHPAGWGPHRHGVLRQALARCGLGSVTLLPAPVAAAHAVGAAPDAAPWPVAVLDLGADPVEAAVVAPGPGGTYALVSRVEGAEVPPMDDVLADLVGDRLDTGPDDVDPADPLARQAIARLRADSTAAACALATAERVGVRVHPPLSAVTVTLTRAEVHERAEPWLRPPIDALGRAIHSSRTAPAAVVLTGPPTLIPTLARLASTHLGCPTTADPHPEHTVARGAALAALSCAAGPPAARAAGPQVARPPSGAAGPRVALPPLGAADAGSMGDSSERFRSADVGGVVAATPPRPPVDIEPPDLEPPRSLVRLVAGRPLVLAAAAVVIVVGVALTLVLLPPHAGLVGPGPTPTPPAAGVPQPGTNR